jgi:hypothetical protein
MKNTERMIPQTVEQFVCDFIEEAGEAECRKAIAKYGADFDMGNFHHGLGRNIRNEFSLWTEESGPLKADLWNKIGFLARAKYNKHWSAYPECKDQFQGANMHGDDASHELIKFLWKDMVRRFR